MNKKLFGQTVLTVSLFFSSYAIQALDDNNPNLNELSRQYNRTRRCGESGNANLKDNACDKAQKIKSSLIQFGYKFPKKVEMVLAAFQVMKNGELPESKDLPSEQEVTDAVLILRAELNAELKNLELICDDAQAFILGQIYKMKSETERYESMKADQEAADKDTQNNDSENNNKEENNVYWLEVEAARDEPGPIMA